MQPRYVVEPESAERLAGLLAWASQEHVSLVLRGGGTKLGWGRRGGRIDLLASTARLDRVLAHEHGDLTATVEAGATIGDVNRRLARHGQWLPLQTSFEQATVGGTIATNESGPLRHRHGTPRDLLIGVQLATTDGRLVKAGGNVVKNVAGYDLGKLVCGSFGSLAAIVTATFKLAPLPAASTTLAASFGDRQALVQAVQAVGASQLEPSAFDLRVAFNPATAGSHVQPGTQQRVPGEAGAEVQSFSSNVAAAPPPHVASGFSRTADVQTADGTVQSKPSYTLLIQFASTPAAIEAQIDVARRLCAGAGVEIVTGADEAARWDEQARRLWNAPGMIVRVSWLPAALESLIAIVERIAAGAASIELTGRAGVGAGLVRVEADAAAQVRAVAELRGQSPIVGHVVVLRAEQAVKEQADVWGPAGDTAALMRAIKQALDPAAILNANRGPL
ncbi:MAG: FAD-binding oxidoreductase [Acidobacteriota bacterium]